MSKYAVSFILATGLCLWSACASAPEPEPEEDDMPAWVTQGAREKERPVYHAESDAERLDKREARPIISQICASAEDAEACSDELGAGLRGYRGAFSEPGADEWIVAAGADAALLTRAGSEWVVSSRLPDVDVEGCRLLGHASGLDALLCRVPVFREDGYALELYEVGVSDDGQLVIDALDIPKVTDVDTVFFAGWRDDGGLQIRIHDAKTVRGPKTLDMNAGASCRHRTFDVRANSEVSLHEVDACTTELTSEQGARNQSSYESRLREPIMEKNRDYVMCYQRELERLREEAKQRAELIDACIEGTAEEPDDCPPDEELEAIEEERAAEDSDDQSDEAGDEEDDEPRLAGELRARLVIGSPGAAVSCEVVETTMQSERVETCLCRELMKTSFPPVPEGKFFDVTYPFEFSPDF